MQLNKRLLTKLAIKIMMLKKSIVTSEEDLEIIIRNYMKTSVRELAVIFVIFSGHFSNDLCCAGEMEKYLGRGKSQTIIP